MNNKKLRKFSGLFYFEPVGKEAGNDNKTKDQVCTFALVKKVV
jgi:hypothetical protein